jgi:DNA-binding PucR family transcriptional regulator
MTPLESVLSRLGDLVEVLNPAAIGLRRVRAYRIIDAAEVISDAADRSDEMLLLVGAVPDMPSLAAAFARAHPAMIVAKDDDGTPWRSFARNATMPVGLARGDSSWDELNRTMLSVMRATSASEPSAVDESDAYSAQQSDLFDLAVSLAGQVRGYVTIDDNHARTLAFSPLDEGADDLRRASVLGRAAPPGHVNQLRQTGVWDRIRRGELVELAGNGATMPRLGIGMIDDVDGSHIGTIWVQRGQEPFAPRARQLLTAASSVAVGVLRQRQRLRARERVTLSHLLGLTESSESRNALAITLGLERVTDWAVGAFAASGAADSAALAGRVQLLIGLESAIASRSPQILSTGSITFVVLPSPLPGVDLEMWAGHVADTIRRDIGLEVRAALGPRSESVEDLPMMREACESLLRVNTIDGESHVLSYRAYRSHIALSRIVRALVADGLVDGARVRALRASRYVDGEELIATLDAYLSSNCSTGSAAGALAIHPNTLRQRLKRVSQTAGIDLDDSADRLAMELELHAVRLGLV